MKTAVIALTKNGVELSKKIADNLENCTRYAFEKYADDSMSFTDLKALTKEVFGQFDGIIYICACGIAVRMIAPFIKSKTEDPAVIVIDEQGKFAVSLLSGHIGGANELTKTVSDITGAAAVITTATDAGGKFSPDSFALANGLYIADMDMAKAVASAVVDGEKIGLKSDYKCINIPDCFGNTEETGVVISEDTAKNTFKKTLHLVPKDIVIGIGCKKGTDKDALSEFIKSQGIDIHRIAEVRTIDIKKDEEAIADFCRTNKIPLKCYTAEELMSLNGDFSSSDFVMKTVGADNVCERSASMGGAKLLVKKQSKDGMTFAAAKTEIIIDFKKEIKI